MKDAPREIWLRWYWRGIFPGAKATHWKGYMLMYSPLALVAAVAYVSEKKMPLIALYWLGAFACVAVYWMLVLDHSEWEKSPS